MLYLATNQLAHLIFFIVWKETIVIPCSFDHQKTPLSKWQSACLRKTLPLKDSEGFARLFAQGLNSDSVKFQNNTFSGRPPKNNLPKRSMIKGIYIYIYVAFMLPLPQFSIYFHFIRWKYHTKPHGPLPIVPTKLGGSWGWSTSPQKRHQNFPREKWRLPQLPCDLGLEKNRYHPQIATIPA